MNPVQENRPPAASRQADILIVDDNPDFRKVFVALFGGDYRMVEASNGPEALALLAARAPRLMVLDFSMPGMDGLEVLRAAKTAQPSLLVIMLTSERDIEKARFALSLGAHAFITKPFDVESLRVELKRILDAAKDDDASGRPWRVRTSAKRSAVLDRPR